MRPTEAREPVPTVFQCKPWLQWLVVFTTPMLFFSIDRLASVPALLDSFAPDDKDRTAANQVAGMLLGLLEDFIVTVLLVLSLMIVDFVSLLCSRIMTRTRAEEHFHTSMLLRGVGHLLRFGAAFALIALALTPFALDLTLLHSQQRRLSTGVSLSQTEGSESPRRDQLHSHESSSRDGLVGTLFSIALVSAALALLFVWRMNLTHWWPTQEDTKQSEPQLSMSFSTPTYMDIGFEPYKVERSDIEAGKTNSDEDGRGLSSRHTTIVSAPCELYGEDDTTAQSSVMQRKAVCPARLLDPWSWIVLVVCGGIGVFILFVDITRSASQAANPLVAGIALNPSLNELVHNLFQIQFLPPEA